MITTDFEVNQSKFKVTVTINILIWTKPCPDESQNSPRFLKFGTDMRLGV